MRRVTAALFAGALGLLFVSAGCATSSAQAVQEPKKCEVQKVSVSLIASPDINPTLDGESRPVLVRVYQLKNDVRFQNAKFDEIWKEEKETLGDDVVKRDELYAYPNSRTELKFERDPAAENIVVAGLFRNNTGRSWYTSFDLPPPPGKGDCTIPGCEGEKECDMSRVNPRFSIWMDESRVDDGTGHQDDITDVRRVRVVYLSKPVAAAPPAGATGPAAPAASAGP